MRKAIVVSAALLFTTPAFAQSSQGVAKRGFFFGAPGVLNGTEAATIHIGGGTESVWPSGLGFAFDAGYLTVPSGFTGRALTISPAAIYEFPVDGPVKPYLRGGVTIVAARDSPDLQWTVGGGVNYWFKDRLALKFEVREAFGHGFLRPGSLSLMAGLCFRY